MPRILIIEDVELWQEKYRKKLPATVEIVRATTMREAKVEMAIMATGGNPFDAIVVDGYLDGEQTDTRRLVELLRASGFSGPLIAASGSSEFNEVLMKAGCTHNAVNKAAVAHTLLRILHLPSA